MSLQFWKLHGYTCIFQSVNEESLKILHEYVASLHTHRTYSLQPIDLIFYIRNPNNHKGKLCQYKPHTWLRQCIQLPASISKGCWFKCKLAYCCVLWAKNVTHLCLNLKCCQLLAKKAVFMSTKNIVKINGYHYVIERLFLNSIYKDNPNIQNSLPYNIHVSKLLYSFMVQIQNFLFDWKLHIVETLAAHHSGPVSIPVIGKWDGTWMWSQGWSGGFSQSTSNSCPQ